MKTGQYESYLGDGVYVMFDGYHIWLQTQEGNRIALEPQVYEALVTYRARIMKENNHVQDY